MKEIVLQCPICRQSVIWNKENVHRPFCSARCKLIDLGEWANEQRRIVSPSSEIDGFAKDLKITIH